MCVLEVFVIILAHLSTKNFGNHQGRMVHTFIKKYEEGPYEKNPLLDAPRTHRRLGVLTNFLSILLGGVHR